MCTSCKNPLILNKFLKKFLTVIIGRYLMNMNNCRLKLWKLDVFVPINTWWNIVVKISSTFEWDFIRSMLFVSIKCCHVLELIGMCSIFFILFLVVFPNTKGNYNYHTTVRFINILKMNCCFCQIIY